MPSSTRTSPARSSRRDQGGRLRHRLGCARGVRPLGNAGAAAFRARVPTAETGALPGRGPFPGRVHGPQGGGHHSVCHRATGRRGIICHLEDIERAVAGEAGTRSRDERQPDTRRRTHEAQKRDHHRRRRARLSQLQHLAIATTTAYRVVAFTAAQIPDIAGAQVSGGAGRQALPQGHPHPPRGRSARAHPRAGRRRLRVRLQRRLLPARHERRRRRAGGGCQLRAARARRTPC
ncbi:MAG: hypothetical protein MZV63_58485 [Marinilabiliales bacterium]|nr:hypothetical protein [Marinilabiliales bacterium]